MPFVSGWFIAHFVIVFYEIGLHFISVFHSRELSGGSQSRSACGGEATEKSVPTGNRTQIAQPIASHYTELATPAPNETNL